jgi:hypothetical protein
MGAGKSQIRAHLAEKMGFTHLSFATPLKDIFASVVGRPIDKKIDREALQNLGNGARLDSNTWVRPSQFRPQWYRLARLHWMIWPGDFKFRYRAALKKHFFGKAFDAQFGYANYWVDQLVSQFVNKVSVDEDFAAVIDDGRYVNEISTLQALGFTVVRVEAPMEVIKQRLLSRDGRYDPKWFEHPSEKEQRGIKEDFIINNTLTVKDAANQLMAWLIHQTDDQSAQ